MNLGIVHIFQPFLHPLVQRKLVHRNFPGTAAPMTYTPSGPILSSKPWLPAMESWRLCTFGTSWSRFPKSHTLKMFRRQSHVISCCLQTTERETGAPTNVPAARSHHLPPGFGGTVFKGGSSKMLNDQVTIISSSPIIQSLKTGHSKLCQQAINTGIGPHF